MANEVIRRNHFDRDRQHGRIEVSKSADGKSFTAKIPGQNVAATAPSEQEAIRAVKKEFDAKFRQGQHNSVGS